jgi:hypothetical protein
MPLDPAAVLLVHLPCSSCSSPPPVVLSVTGAAPSSKKPHIVQMILNDLGWNDVGWNNPRLKTPTLDALQSAGVLLTDFYVERYCPPARSAFFLRRHQCLVKCHQSPIGATGGLAAAAATKTCFVKNAYPPTPQEVSCWSRTNHRAGGRTSTSAVDAAARAADCLLFAICADALSTE